jgi:hypothetical protein
VFLAKGAMGASRDAPFKVAETVEKLSNFIIPIPYPVDFTNSQVVMPQQPLADRFHPKQIVVSLMIMDLKFALLNTKNLFRNSA